MLNFVHEHENNSELIYMREIQQVIQSIMNWNIQVRKSMTNKSNLNQLHKY